jgi:hypothetical protein
MFLWTRTGRRQHSWIHMYIVEILLQVRVSKV